MGGVGARRTNYSGGLMMERKEAAGSAASLLPPGHNPFCFSNQMPVGGLPGRLPPRFSKLNWLDPSELFPKIKKQFNNLSPRLKTQYLQQMTVNLTSVGNFSQYLFQIVTLYIVV